jgi:ankyrin repeat protein
MTEPSNYIQALFAAIQKSDVEQARQLITAGVALNHKDVNGRTALTLASSVGNSEIIQLLISAGARVNLESEPLALNPQITSTTLLGGQNLGNLIAQATAEAPEEVKNFYAGFMSIVDMLSVHQAHDGSDDEFIDEQPSIKVDNSEDYENKNEESASTPLEAAVLKGDIDTVRILLDAGANPNPSVWHETPVLVSAARKGQVEIVQVLIAAGANVNRGFDELPLHTAAEEGHLAVVRFLLEAGANIEGYEEDNWTALMDASCAGHLSVVQFLVEQGADVNAWSQGETPLMLAARNVHREIYEFLYPLVSDEIREIGDRDAEKEMSRTIRRQTREQNKAVEELNEAAMYGNLLQVQQLIAAGVDGNLLQVQQLIAAGVDVNAIAACNRTALSLAIQGGKIPVIQVLLKAGADPNLPDETDDALAANSPLMEASSTFFATNRGDMVRLLIQHGANLNQQDAGGRTALMQALGYSDINVIETLVKSGADLDIQDNEGNTVLMMAELNKSIKLIDLLKQAGASQQGLKEVELLHAIDRGDIDRIKVLLPENLNLNIRLGQTTMLCRAAYEGYPEVAKLLIEAGADVNKRASEGYFNPLLYAAYSGNLEVVRILLKAGADVNARVQDYLNPLEYAERGKYEGHRKDQPFDEVIALLENYGATRSV